MRKLVASKIPESTWWAHLRAGVPALWQRMENRIAVGVPDACGLLGARVMVWVELKSTKGWSRTLTVRKEQVVWLKRWGDAGGNVWVLAKVGNTALLIHGSQLTPGGMPKAQWLARAALVCVGTMDWSAVRKVMRSWARGGGRALPSFAK